MHFFSNPFRVTFSSLHQHQSVCRALNCCCCSMIEPRTNWCWSWCWWCISATAAGAATNLFSSLTLHFNWFYSSAMCGLFSPFSHSDCIGSRGRSVGWLCQRIKPQGTPSSATIATFQSTASTRVEQSRAAAESIGLYQMAIHLRVMSRSSSANHWESTRFHLRAHL